MSGPQQILAALPMPALLLGGGRVLAANERLAALLGYSLAQLLDLDPFEALLFAEAREPQRRRYQARRDQQPAPDDYELVLRHSSGAAVPVRVHVAPFPLAGPDAQLYLSEESHERSRSAGLIRGLVDVSVAVQREQTEAGIFRAVREQLSALGLGCAICEVDGPRLRLLLASAPEGPLAKALLGRGTGWVEVAELPGGMHWASPQGVLIEDVPALLGAIERRPPSQLAHHAGLRAVAAAVPVDGHDAYAIAAISPGLDSTVAGAFGLFGKQVGAAIETVRRMDELARRNTELLLVNHVAKATATLGSGVALQAALDHVAAAVRADAMGLFRCAEDWLTLSVSRGFPFGWATSNQRVSTRARVPWAEAAAQREIVHYAVEGDRLMKSAPRTSTPPHGVRRVRPDQPDRPPPADAYGVAVPLVHTDRVHGLLLLLRKSPAFDNAELELLSTVSAQLAVNLQNEALFDEAQRRVSELSLLLDLGQAVVSSLELPKVLAEGARVAVRMLRCSAAYVMVPDESGQHLVCAAGADPHVGGALIGKKVSLTLPSMSALAFKTQKAQATSNPGDIDPLLVADFGCLSTLAVPLHHGEKSVGVLCLIERAEPRVFDVQDVRLANHAANLITVALENARLYAEQRARAEEMARLNELSRSLVGAVELRPILEEAARTMRQLVDASNCFILLYDAPAREIRLGVAPAPFSESLRGLKVSIDATGSLAARALRERRPLQETSLADAHHVNHELVKLIGEKSMLAVPLLAREEMVGVVVLDETRRERVFSQAEIDRVTAVAAPIALAMLAARLYEDLRRSHADLLRTQAELVERERLAVVGELSASIAHEVRNPLGVIFNSLGSLRRLLAPAQPRSPAREGDVAMLLDIVGEEADRLNRIVGDLLDFARPMTPVVQQTPLLPLLEDAVTAARAQMDNTVASEVKVSVSSEVDALPADSRLLRQAVVNLVLNALQALGRSGHVEVRARAAERAGKAGALVTISDTGPGIAPQLIARVFQPFFTTKAKGTGLGLAVVRRIAEGHGGTIAAQERAEGEGARFELWLPL